MSEAASLGRSVSGRLDPYPGVKVGFFLVFLMIHVLFRKFSFSFWTVLSMITSDNVVEDALRTSAADSAVGIQRRDSL